MSDYLRYSCGHTIYSTLTQLYRYSSMAQEHYKFQQKTDAKAFFNEFCTISMGGPRQSGWDMGLSLFVENEITRDSGKKLYTDSHLDAVIIFPTMNMADIFCSRIKDRSNKYLFTNNNHARIMVTSLGSNNFLGYDTNKVIFHNYTIMKKVPLHKNKLKGVKNALWPVLAGHEKKFLIKIC